MALEWVRDNIEAFGGDPDNVTIFGESGGGAKVSTLLAMPRAQGLFHKGIIQSGAGLRMVPREDAAALAERVLSSLGVARGDVHALQAIDYKQVIDAALKARPPRSAGSGSRSLSPVVDGRSLPRHPFDPDAPTISAKIPLIAGTCKDEATLFALFDPRFGKMTLDETRQSFAAILADRADAALELFRKRRPNDLPSHWYTSMLTATGPWQQTIEFAERKQAQHAAPIYMYRLDWETPVLDGVLLAPHGLDTSLVFDNASRGGAVTGPGPEAGNIAADMSQAWINFARTGNPSWGETRWPAYETGTRQTMIFDLPSHTASDPDQAIREFLSI